MAVNGVCCERMKKKNAIDYSHKPKDFNKIIKELLFQTKFEGF